MIAQSELSELCLLLDSGERKAFFSSYFPHMESFAAGHWDLLAELSDIRNLEQSSNPKLESEGPMRFQGRAGSCSEGFSYWTIVSS